MADCPAIIAAVGGEALTLKSPTDRVIVVKLWPDPELEVADIVRA